MPVDGSADHTGFETAGICVSTSIETLQQRNRARLAVLLRRFDLQPEFDETPPPAQPMLLSPHQQWIFQERLDLHSEFDLSKEVDQARLLNWSLHHMRDEYDAPEDPLAWGHLSSPFDVSAGPFASLLTIVMRKSYVLRKKLQARFDLATTEGRVGFIDWFFRRGMFEDKLDETPYVHHVLPALSAPASNDESELPINRFAALIIHRYRSEFRPSELKSAARVDAALNRVLNRAAPELLYIAGLLPDGAWPVNRKLSLREATATLPPTECANDDPEGANLIGYAHGAFGMGEHVKMAARALAVWSDKFSIVDVNAYVHARQPEPDILAWSQRPERYPTNIFHVNADSMAGALSSVGPSLAIGRYNIGYWAWELSKVPDAWQPSIEFVDEIWAPSRFIQEAFQEVTDKPVIHMPLCVDLSFDAWKRRSFFGLPEDKFLFLYYFDSHSYYQRKNPFAALRAFQIAFPDRQDVGLVIKTQNARQSSTEWLELLALAEGDARVHILNQTMTKGEVLSLQVECDCFVSLHRSEGFGRGPAEAMWLGKPVVVTGYSGNMDFTLPDNSLLVDFELIRVKPAEYPFFRGQVWAQPDEEHAAHQMRRLVEEPGLAEDLGRRGASLMRNEFSYQAVGRRYADRLREISGLRLSGA
jgi:glycosyltransferase involved in cell wall biosynthesis